MIIKQYYSKLYHEWKDFKVTDCEASLRKYGYLIREIEREVICLK